MEHFFVHMTPIQYSARYLRLSRTLSAVLVSNSGLHYARLKRKRYSDFCHFEVQVINRKVSSLFYRI